ncbi:MAG TPA: TIGR00730 family Rossman fold protein [Bacteroidia bacterium]|nr:TIGR00730 family Rossman fold protein [Bacteroidia bacterium]HNT79816.1 TIGR00730 family Rossman fold protein [Bacteroidia bacterium]
MTTRTKLNTKDGLPFLEGARSRSSELFFSFKVLLEFIKGFRALHFTSPCITVFGSARFKEDHVYYKAAYEFGKEIAKTGITVMTGGGPGIMEAANRGAYENGGFSAGCNITLPHEQSPNPYMHQWTTMNFFFVRKVLLLKYSVAFVVLPGGVGTMDELFETLTLIQTATINDFPVIVYGTDYYKNLKELLEEMEQQKTISSKDLDLVLFTDSIEDAMNHIQKYLKENYQVKRVKPRRIFLEKLFKQRTSEEASL